MTNDEIKRAVVLIVIIVITIILFTKLFKSSIINKN